MKIASKLISLLLSICIVFGCASVVGAVGGESNVRMKVSSTSVNVGDEVTVTLGCVEHEVAGFGFYLEFDKDLLECTYVAGPDGDNYYYILYLNSRGRENEAEPQVADTVADTNKDGIYSFGWVPGSNTTILEQDLITLTFVAKAAGTVTFVLTEESSGSDAFKGVAATQTLIIKGNEPVHECAAGEVSYVKGENGKHTKIVACADNCGKNFSETEEPCSGGTADCENAAVCEFCGNTYGSAEGHGSFQYVHTPGNNTHAVVCGVCTETIETVACTFEAGSHVCKFACGNETDCNDGDNDHICDVCDKELTTCDKNLTKTNEVSATCSGDGVKAYWTCSCGKHYADAEATELIENLTAWKSGDGKIPATGEHNYVAGEPVLYAKKGTFTVTGTCGCGEEVTATAEATEEYTAGDCQTQEVTVYTATFTESWFAQTVTKEVKGDWNYSVHIGEQKTEYTDNGDTHTVKVYYPQCGHVISEDTVGHGYENNYMCDCGAAYTGWIDDAYYQDAVMLTGWNEIEGSWYYLDPTTGARAEGNVRVPYPTAAINGVTYAPNADDVAYAQENAESKYTDAETAVFVFGEDGKFQQTTGIVEDNDTVRYAVNGMIGWHVGMVEVEGEYYYFIGDVNGGGNIGAEGDTYLTRINGMEGFDEKGVYNFEDGKLSGLNGLVDRYGDGVLYYYENSKLMVGNGLTKIGEQYVYVRSTNGQIVSGQYWVAKTNGYCNPGLYTFDENGYLQTAKDPTVNGLVDGVYYKDGMPYYAGLIVIDGDTYYINSAGEAVTGTYYVTKLDNYTGDLDVTRGTKLTFDADGKLVTE